MTDKASISKRVRELLAIVLRRPVAFDEEVDQAYEPRWDSLKHMELMLSLEEAFGVDFDPDDFALMTNVQACVEQISRRLNIV
jgi:acyl carrier protein